MDVTRSNYESLLPEIESAINEASFLVIDTELSGLMNGKDANPFDTPAEYYAALLAGASDFLLLQFGLCAFRWNSDTKKYQNRAYNFYLFPSKPDRFFLCQSSSISFLVSHGFDFNKLFRDGIPYLTEPIESKLRDQLEEKQKNYNSTDNKSDYIPVPEENRSQIEELCSKVKSFLDAEQPEVLEIDKLNAFIRKLAFQELGKKYGDRVFMETQTTPSKSRVLVVTRASKQSQEKLVEDRKQKEWDELYATVGFSKVARLIGQSGKLVIGHNMLLDLVHSLNHFFSPLPADYMEFKEFANCMFPSLLDTKYMSSLPPFKDKVQSSALPNLLEALSSAPFGIPEIDAEPGKGYLYNQGSNKDHEAGFDAFITGVCFLAMHEHLARMRGANPGEMIVAAESPLLRPYLNKVFLFKTAHQESPYMNLSGKDPTPSRDHVFHVTFPKEWVKSDIVHLFSPFGSVFISFLDDTSAFVSLLHREHTTSVLKNLSSCRKYTITPFKKFKAQLATTQANGGRFQWLSKWHDSVRAPAETATQPQNRKRRHTQTESVEADSSKSLQRQVSASTSVCNSVPVQREVEAKSQTETGSVSSSVGEHKSRKRRTTSGVFQVQEIDEDLQILCEMRKKRMAVEQGGKKVDTESKHSLVTSYQENDNWD